MGADETQYLVFARYPAVNLPDRPGWGEALMAGSFNGHEDARDDAVEHAYHTLGFYAHCELRVLTVCITEPYNSVREWSVNITYKEVA